LLRVLSHCDDGNHPAHLRVIKAGRLVGWRTCWISHLSHLSPWTFVHGHPNRKETRETELPPTPPEWNTERRGDGAPG